MGDWSFTPLGLDGACLVEGSCREDERGYFSRVYDERVFAEGGLHRVWLQENESLSRSPGTLRGFHFQRPPFAETKLVRVARGAVLDVIVDLRGGSASFGRHEAVELSAANRRMLYVPRGFAHGYCTLTEEALVLYKVDSRYHPEAEGGVLWSDPDLSVSWPVKDPILSPKDARLPPLRDLSSPFVGDPAGWGEPSVTDPNA